MLLQNVYNWKTNSGANENKDKIRKKKSCSAPPKKVSFLPFSKPIDLDLSISMFLRYGINCLQKKKIKTEKCTATAGLKLTTSGLWGLHSVCVAVQISATAGESESEWYYKSRGQHFFFVVAWFIGNCNKYCKKYRQWKIKIKMKSSTGLGLKSLISLLTAQCFYQLHHKTSLEWFHFKAVFFCSWVLEPKL